MLRSNYSNSITTTLTVHSTEKDSKIYSIHVNIYTEVSSVFFFSDEQSSRERKNLCPPLSLDTVSHFDWALLFLSSYLYVILITAFVLAAGE